MFTCYLNPQYVIFQDLHQEVGFGAVFGGFFFTVKGCLNVSHIQLTVTPTSLSFSFQGFMNKGYVVPLG